MFRFFFRRGLPVLVLSLLWAGTAFAQPLEEKVYEHTFANGLRLLVVERHESPTFAAYITFGVGSVNETSETRGVAHLLEHMLFKGTETLGTKDFAREKPLLDAIEEVGEALDAQLRQAPADPQKIAELEKELARLQQEHSRYVVKDEFSRIYSENGGVGYNAYTSKDLTTYLISLPANKLELWASLESDRMKNAVLREFYTERNVIMEERRRSYESEPDGLLYENLLAAAFTVHPYRNPIIGWMSDIENLSLKETRGFLHKYYAPVNTVITLVGDLDTAAAVSLVEDYFGTLPAGEPVPRVTAVEPPQKGEKRIHIQFDAEPQLAIAFHKPTLPERADYVFDVIDQILSQGRTSRLYRALVVEKGLAASVSTYSAPGSRYPNLFVVSATPRHPHTLAEVEEAIYAELERLAKEPVSDEELEQARNRLRVDRLRYLKGNSGLARMLSYYQSVAGNWRYLVGYDQEIASMTAAEIMETARLWLVPRNRTVAILDKEED
ncbi:putative Zn-dependent peptidase [Desulfuromonas soudanensis]|uniref:Putative Zn-dependent peptidase n=1 Tax=Desulfuromonas soudanensis TaxID=1603606 RepID=A0A0M3QG25_9BACT|nr:pitrilysin family protein [Desulfuromonas soudanensis]ALC17063.1 putative Zn-dependent peptidase [Desulfuromonas soudanensis]